MASALHTALTPHTLSPASKSKFSLKNQLLPPKPSPTSLTTASSTPKRRCATQSVAKDVDVLPLQSSDEHQDGAMALRMEREADRGDLMGQVVASFEGRLSLDGLNGGLDTVGIGGGGGGGGGKNDGGEDFEKLIDRAINASIVLAAGSFAVTKLLTIDHDYWHGWTLFEILRYAPQHSWTAYEEALKTNPVLAKMMISGVVYSAGDWIAQD